MALLSRRSTNSGGPSPEQPVETPPTGSAPAPTTPGALGFDVIKFRESDDGKALAGWVKSEFQKAKDGRKAKELQWYTNLSMVFGNQWVRAASGGGSATSPALVKPQTPYYRGRKTVNRLRAFTRWELSKYVSQTPSIMAIPGTGADEDARASYAAEQVWESVSAGGKLRKVFTNAAWWTIHTGNGFIKTEWDRTLGPDSAFGRLGDIRFSCLTPFNLFVPDMKESDIEDQPFIFMAYPKTVSWVKNFFADQLGKAKLEPSVSGANDLLDPAYLNMTQQGQQAKNSVMVYEAWIKPGGCDLMPNGGLVIMADDVLLAVDDQGMAYSHGQYPVTHFGHLYTGGFYRDSPLVDLLPLQKEFNGLRSDIALAGKMMARPQLLAQKGSVIVQKITNEPGLVIEYLPGAPPPSPMPMPELPSYFVQQQDRVLQDFNDISGQQDASTGNAPAGVTAGTAISYLQEAANKYLTPQYQDIEHGWERIATQALSLFVQYVDIERAIKTVGADMAFDTMTLKGSDIAAGCDVRVEAGSSVSQSKAANDAKVMDMFSVGLLQPDEARKMLEVGGFQRMQDIVKAAEKKANRENTKMKDLSLQDIQAAQAAEQDEMLQQAQSEMAAAPETFDGTLLDQITQLPAPSVIKVADFDVHELHIQVHNQFRMGQEYESLPPEVQQQFEQHVAEHQRYLQQQQMQGFLAAMPDDGSEGGPGTANLDPGAAAEAGMQQAATVAPEAAGAPAPMPGG